MPETAVCRGRACPARSLASAPGFVLHPLYLLHRREGLRGCEQGPRLSGAKPGCEQCLPLRGKQPHERVCEANWRRSLCAAKRDPRLGGCTPPRPPIRKSEGPMAKRTQYYCPFLTPSALSPLLSREFPRTPAGGRWRPPCQRGLAALADWGIPTGCAWPPIPGQPSHAKRGRAVALPCPSRPRPVYGSL